MPRWRDGKEHISAERGAHWLHRVWADLATSTQTTFLDTDGHCAFWKHFLFWVLNSNSRSFSPVSQLAPFEPLCLANQLLLGL